MKLIENLNYLENSQSWKFSVEDITYFLTNGGKGTNNGEFYTWRIPNGQENEVFGILGDGNLLENNEVIAYNILNRRKTNENYIISLYDFRMQMVISQ